MEEIVVEMVLVSYGQSFLMVPRLRLVYVCNCHVHLSASRPVAGEDYTPDWQVGRYSS